MRDKTFSEIADEIEASGKETEQCRIAGAAKVMQAAQRAARNTRFRALPVACRHNAADPEFYESGVIIERVSFKELEQGFTIACRVYLRSASGQRASGMGAAVKGRKDVFEPHIGAGHALRQAMEGAFTVLGQREGTAPGPSPFARRDWIPADALYIEDFSQLLGTELLCHYASLPF